MAPARHQCDLTPGHAEAKPDNRLSVFTDILGAARFNRCGLNQNDPADGVALSGGVGVLGGNF